MTAPTGPVSQTFEEIEQATKDAAAPPPPKLDDIKVPEAEGVPDEFKGKSMAEIIKIANDRAEAVKLSAQRQRELEDQARLASAAGATVVTEESKPEPELTKEQITELYQKDPIQAIEYMQAQAERRVEANVSKRLSTLTTGAASSLEQAARVRYPDEFALFGDQIAETLKLVPKGNMAQPQAWDDLVSFIRGKPENIDKLFDFRVNKAKGKQAADAQAAQAAAAGASVQTVTHAPAAVGGKGAEGLDALELEIAGKMGLSPAEYAKWKRVA